MISRILLTALLASSVYLSGCTTTSTVERLGYNIAIQQATSKFIEHKETPAERQRRAAEIVRVVGILQQTAEGEVTTVAELESRAFDLIEGAHLELSDQALANTVVAAVAEGLRDRISDGLLSPDERVRVVAVLDQIAATARVYLVPGPSSAIPAIQGEHDGSAYLELFRRPRFG